MPCPWRQTNKKIRRKNVKERRSQIGNYKEKGREIERGNKKEIDVIMIMEGIIITTAQIIVHEKKKSIKLLLENCKDKATLESRSKLGDNIKLNLKKTGREDVAIGLIWLRT
jgi:hypothetical protein